MVRRDKRKERPRERERVLLTQLDAIAEHDAIAEQPRAPRMPVKEVPQGFYKIWY